MMRRESVVIAILLFLLIDVTCQTTLAKNVPAALGKIKSTKPVICNKQNFEPLKRCCKGSVGRFFTDAEIKICTKGLSDRRLLTFTNFNFHSLYDKNNNFVFDSTATKNALGPLFAVNECLFRGKKNLIDASDNIIYDNIVTLITPAFSANMLSAGAPPAVASASLPAEMTKLCKTVVEAMVPKLMTTQYNKTSSATSLTRPFLLMQCLKRTPLDTCPPTLRTTSATCTTAANNLKICGYFNTTVTYLT
ncbi:uncharacterized protein LOC132198197 [Neocloeon triangulifer]|uniref:uncharacterized protein LOC132198197 n=1 Tax=Neocloeon triangulifer TaxID=2078957 RepID=UPI00286F4D4F|nr:uncharacterized protein LOC132198197 [Neocloeon triangulifer]